MDFIVCGKGVIWNKKDIRGVQKNGASILIRTYEAGDKKISFESEEKCKEMFGLIIDQLKV